VRLAEQEATRLGHLHVATHHLLLGILAEGSSVGLFTLCDLGVSLEKLSAALRAAQPPPDDELFFPPASKLKLTRRAAAAIDRARAESQAMGHDYIGTEHLILSLLADPDCIAARALAEQTVHHSTYRTRMIRLLAFGPEDVT
jgi:ATP-dependent Clp protease ATP-binding subunit ClpC